MKNPRHPSPYLLAVHREPLHDGVIDYQGFYEEPVPAILQIDEPTHDRYEATLASLQDAATAGLRWALRRARA